MSRLVDVPPQRVYGSVPLLLPLIKMSTAEGIWLEGQPQIYDKDYPLDFSGLNFSPPWWADTGVGGGLSGVGGGNVRLLPHEMFGMGYMGATAAAQKQAAAAAQRQQQAAAAKQQQQQAAAQKKQAAADAAAKKQADALAQKQKAADAAAAKKQAAADAAAQKKQAAADAAAQKKVTACTSKNGTWDPTALKCTLPLTPAQQNQAAMKTCQDSGGIWNTKTKSCNAGGMPSPEQAACAASGGTWVSLPGTGGGQCTPAQSSSGQCPPGQTWDPIGMVCGPGAVDSTQRRQKCPDGQRWDRASRACMPKDQTQQCPPGQQWDALTMACFAPQTQPPQSQNCPPDSNWDPIAQRCSGPTLVNPVTPPSTTPNPQQDCANAGGYWNGQSCGLPPPNTSNPAMLQCQSVGGYWNGSTCAPPMGTNGPYGQPPPMTQPPMPPPMPTGAPSGSYSGGGGGGGGAPPDMSSGSPMSSGGGPGPQLNEQANEIQKSQGESGTATAEDTDIGDSETTESPDDGSTDDTAKVAGSNVLESVAKLFSGMGGLGYGYNPQPNWFSLQPGGNAPMLGAVGPRQFVAIQDEPIKPSTTTAVVGMAVVLMVGAAAIYVWSQGKK